MRLRLGAGVLFLVVISAAFLLAWQSPVTAKSESGSRIPAADNIAQQEYQSLLEKYQDWTFPQLSEHLNLQPHGDAKLGFEPTEGQYYDIIKDRLDLTEEEESKFSSRGIVVVDPKLNHGFGSIYHQIYTSDLPVLVTTDSVLHAWHRSYDNILIDLESRILLPSLKKMLNECTKQLAKLPKSKPVSTTCRDVDLYLCVARNLVEGAGGEQWNGVLAGQRSVFGNDKEVVEVLKGIQSLKLQTQRPPTESTSIYGGKRYVDYSQFRPRGHYTKSPLLQNYFRCMMWLGRADCGFNVLPVDPAAGLDIDWRREMKAAALLSQLFRDADQMPQLESYCNIVKLLVGESDNLTVSNMVELMAGFDTKHVDWLDRGKSLDELADAIRKSGLARQKIRSQSIVSNPSDTYKMPPPSLFQIFGQAFTADSFVLSHSVFDSIIFQGRKQRRLMPSSLDVAAALGNDLAVELLEPELTEWNYSANLMASRDFVQQLSSGFWNDNVYHRWLDAIRTLDDTPEGQLPKVMTTETWKAKQLQTQLASWTELRHDNVLYAKQSYSAVPGCEYPDAYVEPYPDLYQRLAAAAKEMEVRLDAVAESVAESDLKVFDRQKMFLRRFADIMSQLETISQQELRSQPITDVQRRFLECTVDRRGSLPNGSGSKPKFDGWYFELLYGVSNPLTSDPLVVDVHTNPVAREVLQAGVGNVNFAVVAIDNDGDTAAYVGPVYSYYEFVQPAEQRLNDGEWGAMVSLQTARGAVAPPNVKKKSLPNRPEWTKSFVATPKARTYGGTSVSSSEDGRSLALARFDGMKQEMLFSGVGDDDGLEDLLEKMRLREIRVPFGIHLIRMSDESLERLKKVPQLAWINTTGTKISARSIAKFAKQRPDVEILPEPFAIETAAICDRIDGWQRFYPDESGVVQRGEEVLVYVQANTPTVRRVPFGSVAKMDVNLRLVAKNGKVVFEHKVPPNVIRDVEYKCPNFVSVRCQLPEGIQPGSYQLEVQATDANSVPVNTKQKNISVTVE